MFFETIKDLLTNSSYVIASSQSEIEYGVGKRSNLNIHDILSGIKAGYEIITKCSCLKHDVGNSNLV